MAAPSNWLLGALGESDRAWLDPHLQTVSVHAEQWLWNPAGDHDAVVLPQSAVIAIGAPHPNGGLVETALVGHRGLLGGLEAIGARWPYAACVRLSGEVLQVPRTAFRRALDRSVRMRELVALCEAHTIMQIQQTAYCNALHAVEARLCRKLVQLHDLFPGDRLPLTQDMLAQSLGIRRTTVTAVAGVLQQAGSIQWRRGTVQIVSRDQLVEQACDCYGRLKSFTESWMAAAGWERLASPTLVPERNEPAMPVPHP